MILSRWGLSNIKMTGPINRSDDANLRPSNLRTISILSSLLSLQTSDLNRESQ